jgi:hypothetical protein
MKRADPTKRQSALLRPRAESAQAFDTEDCSTQNCTMSRTVYELVRGELVGDETNHGVEVQLTIDEISEDESAPPTRRVIAHTLVTTRVNAPDGSYVLRFDFEGQRREESVRVESGDVLRSY